MDGEKTVGHCAIKMLFTINVPHVLEKIFFSLDYDSFQTCFRVNRTWNELLSSDSFQKKLHKMMIERAKNGENLWQASKEGNKEEVKRLILHAGWIDVNCFEVSDQSGRQSTPIVKLYFDNGAEPKMVTTKMVTPLHLAAYRGHTDVVQLLLDRKADPNLVNPDTSVQDANVAALHLAALNGHKEVVQVLLDGGANPNVQAFDGWTPLRLARANGCKDVAKLLVARGAKKYNAAHPIVRLSGVMVFM